MTDPQHPQPPGFCTRNGRFDLLRELVAAEPGSRAPAPAPEIPVAVRSGIGRYFRWASRST